MGGGPKTETKSHSTNVNRPLQEAQPLVNRFISGVGGLYGGGAGGGGGTLGGDAIYGSSGTDTLMGSAGNDTLAGYGKRMPPGMTGAGGPAFDFSLNSTETGAFDALGANAAKGNPYAPGVGLLAKDLLAGGTDRTGMVDQAYDQFRTGLTPYATANTDPYADPLFTKALDRITSDTIDLVKSRGDPNISASNYGDFGNRVGEGVGEAAIPFALQARDTAEARKGAAIRDMLSASASTAGLLNGIDTNALARRMQGVGVAGQALEAENFPWRQQLEIEAQKRGIPAKNAALLASLIVPMAQLGSTSNQNSTTETQVHTRPLQTALGPAAMGAGLLGGFGFPGVPGMSLGSGLMAGLGGNLPTAAVFGGSNPFSFR